ncbi:MAG: sirohydrochlorin chelatase [Chloroflexota bacterium]
MVTALRCGERSLEIVGKTAILLLGHGSRADRANDGMQGVAESLRRRGEYQIVETGFMIRNFPSIEDGAALCVGKGADTVLMIPYFLHTGLHLIEDLPNAVPRLEKLHPGVRFVLGQPMGLHPKLVEIVEDRIAECKEAAEQGVSIQGDAILQRGKHLTHEPRTSATPAPLMFAMAASKAAAAALKTQRKLWMVEVSPPEGGRIRVPVRRCEASPDSGGSAVTIDVAGKGDEASETEVYAEAVWRATPGLAVELGQGVSVLDTEKETLIRGIEKAASEALGSVSAERGIRVVVWVPWASKIEG